MSTLETIEREVASLAPTELAAFRTWFADCDAAIWDQQLDADASAGKLDHLADAALEAFKAGKCTEF